MKTPSTSTLAAMALAGGMLSGCAPAGASPAPAPPAADARCAAATHIHTLLDEAGAHSRVERTVRADCSETLSGETRAGRAGATLREYVELDAQGHLVYADVELRGAGATRRALLDRQRGAAWLQRAGSAGFVSIPAGAPWAYTPWGEAATPVAAWVALRAATTAPLVRRLDLDDDVGQDVASDQIAVADGGGHVVVLGDAGVRIEGELVAWQPAAASLRVAMK